MRVFITGGSGFIGSWVVRTLLEKGHQLTVLVRDPNKLPVLQRLENVTLIEKGFRARNEIEAALSTQDACIHIALGWGDTPEEMLENDTKFTTFLLEKAQNSGVEQFIYTSSTAALGEIRQLMTIESVCRPVDLYGATKAASEAFILGYCNQQQQMRGNIIRPGYTFGNPAYDGGVTQPDRRFHKLVWSAIHNEPLNVIKNDGTQFIWAADLARIYSSLLEDRVNREIFHGLACNFISWEEISKEIIEITGSKSPIDVEDKGWGDQPAIYDVSSIEKRWGYRFNGSEMIREHLQYLIRECKKSETFLS